MEVARDHLVDGVERQYSETPAVRASDWFWRPWYAKLLWSMAAVYWIALYATMLAPAGWLSSLVAGAMILLVFLFNPISVIVILGRGFLKAKVACGDWVIVPGVPPEVAEWQKREREVAYINPVDIRSGYMHQDYLDGLTARPSDPAGL